MKMEHITRHRLIDRIFHWLSAAAVLTLLATGLLPVIGWEFAWVMPHWIAGLILTILVVFHVVRSVFWQDLRSMWIGRRDFKQALAMMSGRAEQAGRPGKYSLAQKLMHHAVTLFSLAAIATGILMLAKIDAPFWTRNPYLLSDWNWGVVYILHGLSALFFVSLIMLHIYFALRPEKLFYTRSMIVGWITRRDYAENHDPELWPAVPAPEGHDEVGQDEKGNEA